MRIKTKRQMRHAFFYSLVILLALLLLYVGYLDYQVRDKFEGVRWQVPSRVYARPLELFVGQTISKQTVIEELKLLKYKHKTSVVKPGQFHVDGSEISVYLREFQFWDNKEAALKVSIFLDGEHIGRIVDSSQDKILDTIRFEPLFIGAIYPKLKEDRILVQLDDTPKSLVNALLAVEDKRFHQHMGISIPSILRALLANLSAGRRVQGGSTVTQQLVKNFYLSNEKSIVRKLNEAIMALLLEVHFSKNEILEAYINEIYLGQEGNRAIHGFGLASWFYFEKKLSELKPHEQALLVSLVKGASYYDPRRFPERAKERRNLVLQIMHDSGLLATKDLAKQQLQGLDVVTAKPRGNSPFPAFIGLVKQQLVNDYDENDLKSAGLKIFTSLDPHIQKTAENQTQKTVTAIEVSKGIKVDTLQSAMIISQRQTGEIVAVVGGRNARFDGFNRALHAQRPIGSLVKPAVYLAALQRADRYNLASLVDDSELLVERENGEDWKPANYDRRYHGKIPLFHALAESYNVATVRLGMELGIESVIETINHLGIDQKITTYPSILLGAIDLAPIEVLQMYQTMGNEGFYVPLWSVRAVTTASGEELHRYPTTIERRFEPKTMYLLSNAMQNIAKSGTAKGITSMMSQQLNIAGKTGTTNDTKDSWFAGYTEQYVAVAWMGRDDNLPTGLTGSSGAMKVWAKSMDRIETKPLSVKQPDGIEYRFVDLGSGQMTHKSCSSALEIPMVVVNETELAPCSSNDNLWEKTINQLRNIF